MLRRSRPRLPAPVPLVAAVLALVVGAAAGAGQERASRFYGPDDGLVVPPVWALAQDSVGFIWIGAEAGLFRFDGTEIRRWAAGRISTGVMDVAVSPHGRVTALAMDGRLHAVTPGGAEPIALPWTPRDTPRRSERAMAYDATGDLWVMVGDSVWTLGPGGPRVHTAADFRGERLRGVVKAARGVFVLTPGGLWRAGTGVPPETLYRTDPGTEEVVAWAVEPEPERVLVLLNVATTQIPRLVEVRGGRAKEVPTAEALPRARAVQLRERNGTVWIALDRFLAAVRPGERPELLGTAEGFESGGPLMVDREGSLWLGSFVGLHQYPEPDTRIWAELQGVPSRHTRFVARSGSSTWVMTWNGPARIERDGSGWHVEPVEWDSRSHVCTTPDGSAWTGSSDTGLRLRGPTARPVPGVDPPIHGCAPGRDGGAWLGTSGALWRIPPESGTPVALVPPFPDEPRDPRPALLHDREDRVWVGAGPALCHAPATELEAGAAAVWRCDEVATPSGILAMVQLEDGRLWAAAGSGGLLENRGGGWTTRVLEEGPTQSVQGLRLSPRGGVWVLGEGLLMRVRIDADDRLELLERLTPWHGLRSPSAGDLLEDESGDLWLATNQGAVHLPAAVRFGEPALPPVVLVEGRVDGAEVPVDGPLVLPHDRNRIELRFAALSFRHHAGLRHQVRLSPDEAWSEASGEPLFRWVDLPPGRYHAEYRASRDGVNWSATAGGFAFEVEPPWYSTRTFLLLVGLGAFGLAILVYRSRVAYLVDLERQRTRIAMDLHDQVGSGLASVGILSGVMASDALAPEERTRTAREIADVAEELGHSLSDIVWALDPETSSLAELAARLTEHGERLFADDGASFEADVPAHWPPVTSSMAVRRNVLLIGLEALHNAARHAGARTVRLRIRPDSGDAWRMTVEDDGRGMLRAAEDSPRTRGRGLSGMARRAEAVGATLRVESTPGGGTAVSLVFNPREAGARDLPRGLAERLAGLHRMIMRRRGAGAGPMVSEHGHDPR